MRSLHKMEHSPKRGEGIVLGMSGGIDSSVSAILLKRSDYRVVGVTFNMFATACEKHSRRKSPSERAAAVCGKLGIEHMAVSLEDLFEQKVIRHMVEGYGKGRTPNPCIVCNERIKFPSLAAVADSLGIEKIATGHYARIVKSGSGRALLACALDREKDQAYFLYRVRPKDLDRAVFPMGSLTKSDARKLGREAGLSAGAAGESQDICFIPDGDLAGFLSRRIDSGSGPVVDGRGNPLGTHDGIFRYTVGQRRGFGIAAGKPLYVGRIDSAANTIVLSEDGDLYSDSAVCGDLRFRERIPRLPLEGKIRYRHGPARIASIERKGGRCTVMFCEPQRAITPGQSLVLYRDSVVVGGGIIEPSGGKDRMRG